MTELLYTVKANPYIPIFMLMLILIFIGLFVTIVALPIFTEKVDIYFIGMITTMGVALIGLIASVVVTYNQTMAAQNKEAEVEKVGDKIEVTSKSKWLNDSSFDIVSENETHYYVKNEDKIFEIKKTEVKETNEQFRTSSCK